VSAFAGWAGVGVLAALGAVARFTIDGAVQRRSPWSFPIGILAINVSGSLVLGVLAGAGTSGWPLRLFGAALLGSYTTFSTWMLDSQQLAARANGRGAALDIAGSVALGLAAVALGWAVGSAL
jgi:CrcB protein